VAGDQVKRQELW